MLAICSGAAVLVLAPAAPAAAVAPNGASRMIVWTACDDLPRLSDADLAAWQARGAGGFACMTGHLRGLGGAQAFTGDPDAPINGAEYAQQRALRDSRVIERMRSRGMKAYLGVYLSNYWNPRTPLAEWFDDAGWAQAVLPRMEDTAAAARRLGFAGLAVDSELYPTEGGRDSATWDWNYPGNSRTEGAVRAKAEQRGHELMQTLLDGFPGLELLAYDLQLPDSWGELVQQQVNGTPDAFASRLDVNFLEGLTSARGYTAIRLVDATFYKVPHVGTWDSALRYAYNSLYASLSRRVSNWDYAGPRLYLSPFAWVDAGPCACVFDDARSPAEVGEQLQAFRKWGMGGEFADYANRGLGGFDYSPYAQVMSASTAPAVVDSQPPSLTVASIDANKSGVVLSGTTGDNLAVRMVRWRTDSGRGGAARIDWRIESGNARDGFSAQTRWALRFTPRQGDTRVVITAEDTKGLTRRRVVTLSRDAKRVARRARARRHSRR